jgi:hypothetical protein
METTMLYNADESALVEAREALNGRGGLSWTRPLHRVALSMAIMADALDGALDRSSL